MAKPARAFFAEAARRIGAERSAILFIDDTERNIEGARTAGLVAEQWSFEAGQDALAALLARHGVPTDMWVPRVKVPPLVTKHRRRLVFGLWLCDLTSSTTTQSPPGTVNAGSRWPV